MPETMLAMMNINTQLQKQNLDRELTQEMMRNQRVQSATMFFNQIGKINILNEAFDTGDFTKVEKMFELYNRVVQIA